MQRKFGSGSRGIVRQWLLVFNTVNASDSYRRLVGMCNKVEVHCERWPYCGFTPSQRQCTDPTGVTIFIWLDNGYIIMGQHLDNVDHGILHMLQVDARLYNRP